MCGKLMGKGWQAATPAEIVEDVITSHWRGVETFTGSIIVQDEDRGVPCFTGLYFVEDTLQCVTVGATT